jgi:hypothetical protein
MSYTEIIFGSANNFYDHKAKWEVGEYWTKRGQSLKIDILESIFVK